MADFHQTGVISTLHRLGQPDLTRLERELVSYSDDRPIALVLPSPVSPRLRGPALKGIVDVAAAASTYLREIVVSVSGTDDARPTTKRCATLFSDGVKHASPVSRRCCCGASGAPRFEALHRCAARRRPRPGRATAKDARHGLAYGYVLAIQPVAGDCGSRLRHHRLRPGDCSRAVCVIRPANPNLHYEFAKGYYARVTDRLNGRVTRLVRDGPLLKALDEAVARRPTRCSSIWIRSAIRWRASAR